MESQCLSLNEIYLIYLFGRIIGSKIGNESGKQCSWLILKKNLFWKHMRRICVSPHMFNPPKQKQH